jgi:hypothetical protein
MSKDNNQDSTKENYRESVRLKGIKNSRKFGNGYKYGPHIYGFETKEQLDEWKQSVIDYYVTHKDASLSSIIRYENAQGRPLSINTLSRWIKSAGHEIRFMKRKHIRPKQTTHRRSVSWDEEIDDTLNAFGSKSEALRMAIRMIFGIPEASIVVFLDDVNRLICRYIESTRKFEAFLTGEIPPFQQNMLNVLIQDANEHGVDAIKRFCDRYNMFYLGGDLDIDQ